MLTYESHGVRCNPLVGLTEYIARLRNSSFLARRFSP